MKSIPSRITHCKSRPNTCAKTQDSEKVANDIAEFLKSGGKITKIKTGDFNFMNDLQKGNKKKKYGKNFSIKGSDKK